ncbi:hypothetical protein [Candidatus Carsonella ruddii]|uniref:hypothetical protein n=1 Tax=Carsonella ruddii TaxID=114186 RepID=UPI0006BD1684|nr:hypothetical protein [Candidatus Carsonella ruddii]ALA96820.1 hypothetical protein AMC76_00425 [Candidatus Carsonella ruddii]
MYRLSKVTLDKYYFIKSFISGIKLFSKDLIIIKNFKLKINSCKIKLDNNNIYFIFNNNSRILLLRKIEKIIIINFLKKKKYYCIPIKIVKINSFFKIKLSIVKKKGDERC